MKLLTSGTPSNQEIMLTPLDVRAGFIAVKKLLVFAGQLDVERFEKALADTLASFPVYSGRAFKRDKCYGIRLCDSGIAFYTAHDSANIIKQLPLGAVDNMQRFFPPIDLNPLDKQTSLLTIKATLCSDGFVIGISSSHVLGDGTASWLFLQTLTKLYSGKAIDILPNHNRDTLFKAASTLAEGTIDATYMGIASMGRIENLLFIARCIWGDIVGKSISYPIKYADLPQRDLAAVSDQDYIMAMVARDVAAASDYPELSVGAVYSTRRFAQFGIDETYVGNAICARVTTLPQARWIEDPLFGASALRQTLDALSCADVAAEYEFFKHEYRRESLSRLLPDFIACLFRGGILMNNCTKFPMYSCHLDGKPPTWVYTQPPALPRYVSIFPHPDNDGVVVNLKMPKREIAKLLALPAQQRSFSDFIVN